MVCHTALEFVCGLWTLSCVFIVNETLKWLLMLPIFMQDHSGGDSVALGILYFWW